MKRIVKAAILFVTLISLAERSYASELHLEEIVVSAARSPRAVKELGTNVSVITREDIIKLYKAKNRHKQINMSNVKVYPVK